MPLAGRGRFVKPLAGRGRFIKRKERSFSELFGTRTTSLGREILIGLVLGACWVLVYGTLAVESLR